MDGMPHDQCVDAVSDRARPLGSVPIDAINEFTVESSGMKAEFGRASGRGDVRDQVGDQSVHGNLFEELRNNAMDARGFFADEAPILKQHDFGGTIGGPFIFPKSTTAATNILLRQLSGIPQSRRPQHPDYLTIPPPANYEGDFSGWTRSGVMVPIYDPGSTRPNPAAPAMSGISSRTA